MSADVSATLVGVAVGALLSTVSSMALMRAQRRSQERFEIWIRLLNSYQDFANYARQMISFQGDDPELFSSARAAAHKCVNDARTLETAGRSRVQRMSSVLASIEAAPDDAEGMQDLEDTVDGIYRDFQKDHHLDFERFSARARWWFAPRSGRS